MDNAAKLDIINKIKSKIKKHPVIIQLFKDHDVDVDYLDYFPMGFAKIPVSARTEHGIIWFNEDLLTNGFEEDDHYMVHEVAHVLQQCFGDGPTAGSNNSEDYLNNELEQEGFQVQTEYISDMYGDEAAEDYVENLLDHHDVGDKKERKEKLDDLLVLARSNRVNELLKLAGFPSKKDVTTPENKGLVGFLSEELRPYDKYFPIVWDKLNKEVFSKSDKLDNIKQFYETLEKADNTKILEGGQTAYNILKDMIDKYIFDHFKSFEKNSSLKEIIHDAKFTLKLFENNKQFLERKDINQYKDLDELNAVVQQVALDQEIARQERNLQKRKERDNEKLNVEVEDSVGDSTLLYEDDEVKVYRINSHAGAKAMAGKDTSWCIAGAGPYYDQYTSNNLIFYFVINKTLPVNNPLQKTAIRVLKDFDNSIADVQYTRKTNDGDNRDPQEIPGYSNFSGIIQSDAKAQPPSLMSIIREGEATEEQVQKFWDDNKTATVEEKENLIKYLNLNNYDNKDINDFENMDSYLMLSKKESREKLAESDLSNIDAATAEVIVYNSSSDQTYEKIFEKLVPLNYYLVNARIAYKTKNSILLTKLSYSTFNEVKANVLLNNYTPIKIKEKIILETDIDEFNIKTYDEEGNEKDHWSGTDMLYSGDELGKQVRWSKNPDFVKKIIKKVQDTPYDTKFINFIFANTELSVNDKVHVLNYIYSLNDEYFNHQNIYHLTPDIIIQLIKQKHTFLNYRLISNLYKPEEYFKEIFKDPEVKNILLNSHHGIKEFLANNIAVPMEIRQELLNDPSDVVRSAAQNSLEKDEIFKDMYKGKSASRIDFLLKLAGVKETLETLNISPEITEFILSLPDEEKQHYVSAVMKNKNITLNELKSSAPKVKETVNPYNEHEIALAKHLKDIGYPESVANWYKIQSRKARRGKSLEQLEIDPEVKNNYLDFRRLLRNQEFADWYWGVEPDIFSYTFQTVKPAIDQWHNEQKLIGENLEYKEGDSNILYGPEWKNPAFNGWTIKQIKTDNDLQAEGNKMDHCVGGKDYCTYVQLGDIQIASLRDPSNQPHVTMEIRNLNSTPEFKQIKGRENHEPSPKYKEMIKEWISTLNGPKSEEYPDYDIDDITNENETMNVLRKTHSGTDEYGLKVKSPKFKTMFKYLLNNLENKFGEAYYPKFRDYAKELAQLAVKEDKDKVEAQYKKLLKSTNDIPEHLRPYDNKGLARLFDIESAIVFILDDMGYLDSNVNWQSKRDIEYDGTSWEDKSPQEIEHARDQIKSQNPYAFTEATLQEIEKLLQTGAIPKYKFLEDTKIGNLIPGAYIEGPEVKEQKVARKKLLEMIANS